MAQLDHLMLYQIAFYCHPPNDCVFRNTALSYSVTVASDPAVPCMTGDLPETSRLRLGAWHADMLRTTEQPESFN
jgi:hypothetical protein